jgi:hypothetical protein
MISLLILPFSRNPEAATVVDAYVMNETTRMQR